MPKNRPIFRVAVPAGIGDIVWTLTKIPALKQSLPSYKKIHMTIAGRGVRRSETFTNMFTFIDDARYGIVPIMKKGPNRDDEGFTRFAGSRYRYRKWDLFLIANGHLEHNQPLEEWFPELDTDFEIGKEFVFQEEHVAAAQKLRDRLGKYAVCYFGPKQGNINSGHNRGSLWSPQNWRDLMRWIIEEKDANIVLTGAPYDIDYKRRVMSKVDNRLKDRIFDMVGETTIGETYANILYSKCVISYQSGIGIWANYLGVPTVLWWRPTGDSLTPPRKKRYIINEGMGLCQAPPWTRTNGMFLREVYTRSTPETLSEKIDRLGWFDMTIERNFTERMTLDDVGKDLQCACSINQLG